MYGIINGQYIFSQIFTEMLSALKQQPISLHVNPFQPSAAFHIETSHLICTGNQITCFFMKYNTGLKRG